MAMCVAMLTLSCTHDPSGDYYSKDAEREAGLVTIHIKVPANSTPTRGLLEDLGYLDPEYTVREVHVLLFDDDGEYGGAFEGIELLYSSIDPHTLQFDVKLPGGVWDMMVVANADDIIEDSGIKKGDKRADVEKALLGHMTNKGWDLTDALPMWGLRENYDVDGAAPPDKFSLTRMVAKVDISLSEALKKKEEKGFELRSVRVYNYTMSGRLVPDATKAAGAPSLPAKPDKASKEEFIEYKLPSPYAELKSHIYLFEAPEGVGYNEEGYTENTCLVIGGKYNGGPETFYRIDFVVQDDDENDFLPVLRNNSYRITIMDVASEGETTPEEALESSATNIKADILQWDDHEFNDIVFDGAHYFAITKSKLEFKPFGSEEIKVQIRTDIEDFKLTFKDAELEAPNDTWADKESNFSYKLAKLGDGLYELTVSCDKPNAEKDGGPLTEYWIIEADRMRKQFTVMQDWATDYIMGPTIDYIYPEGTHEDEPLFIQILSTKPVTVDIDFGDSEDGWLMMDGEEDLSDDNNGIYLAKLNLTAGIYKAASVTPAPATVSALTTSLASTLASPYREAIITVSVEDGETKSFKITQERAYLFFSSRSTTQEYRQTRLEEPGEMKTVSVHIATNLPTGELTLKRKTDSHDRVQLNTEKPGFYNLSAASPRNVSFDVDVDLTTDGMPTARFAGSFEISADNDKWGDLPPLTATVSVPSGVVSLFIYWFNAIFTDASEWTPEALSDQKHYLFPWNTVSVGVDVVSDGGLKHDTSNMVLGDGELNAGKEKVNDGDGTTRYPFSYVFDNALQSYTFAFMPEEDGESKKLLFNRVGQEWKIDKTEKTIGYNDEGGHWATITTNVDWSVVATSDGYTGWLRAEEGKAATASSKTLNGSALESTEGNLLVAPKEILPAPALLPVMTVEKKLYYLAEKITTLNAFEEDDYKRTVELGFSNVSKDEALASKFTVTQHAPVLKYVSGLPEEEATIAAAGETYTLKVLTGLTGWTVKVYNEATALSTSTAHTDEAALEATERDANELVVGANDGDDERELTFKLVHPDFDAVEIGTWTQPAKTRFNLPTSGVEAPPGVLGVDGVTGVLTLKGSAGFKNHAEIKNYADQTFGGLSQHTVYVTQFAWGSLIGLRPGENNQDFDREKDLIWAPKEFDETKITNDAKTVVRGSEQAHVNENNPASGTGDPCYFADKGTSTDTWNMPLGDNYYQNRWNNIAYDATMFTSAEPIDGQPGVMDNNNQGWFFPITGYRPVNTSRGRFSTASSRYWSGEFQTGSPLCLDINSGNILGSYAYDASSIRCVVKPRLEKPNSGVEAPPGVLGVDAVTGQLTLRGSTSYSENAAIKKYAVESFGGLSTNKVYMVMFKWGSLVGLSSDSRYNSMAFDPVRQMMWAPDAFDVTKVTSDYTTIPYADGNNFPATNESTGLGDPCGLADKGTSSETWSMPEANTTSWNKSLFDATPTTTITLIFAGSSGRTVQGQDPGWFFAQTGEYASTGMYSSGTIGFYRSSSAGVNSGQTIVLRVPTTVDIQSNYAADKAAAIRCVTPLKAAEIKPPTTGFEAPPGVLGVGAETGKLTLRGSKGFASNHSTNPGNYVANQYAIEKLGGLANETVYVALFRWGGLVAVNGYPKDGSTTWKGLDDVMWAPPGYDFSWITGTPQSLSALPYAENTEIFPATNATTGLGDPCSFADKGNSPQAWRMPNVDYSTNRIEGIDYILATTHYNNTDQLYYYDDMYGGVTPVNMQRYMGNANASIANASSWTKSSASLTQGVVLYNGSSYYTVSVEYSKYFNIVRCVPESTGSSVPPAEFLYWDPAKQTMEVGKWHLPDPPGGLVQHDNILRFKLGSVTGLIEGATVQFEPADIVFKTQGTTATTYADIPYWNNANNGDDTHHKMPGYISSPMYHNEANVNLGFGDPCKLAGLTPAQIAEGNIDNGTYRMARYDETIWYYNAEVLNDKGNPYYGIRMGNEPTTSFLPAFSYLNTGGVLNTKWNDIYYFSGKISTPTNGMYIGFDSNKNWKATNTSSNSYPVRCVKVVK